MKFKYKSIIAVLLCVAIVFGCCACHLRGNKEKKNIAVIVKSTTSDFWGNVENGVNSAATEYNVSVTFEGPDSEEDYITQNKMIKNAIENNVDAIVFSAIDYYKSTELINEAVKKGIKVVTVDSGVDSNMVDMFIGTDNYEAGKKAAEAAIKGFSENEKVCVGIVNYNQSTDNGQRREAGFRDYIESVSNAEITASVNVDSNTTSAQAVSYTHLFGECGEEKFSREISALKEIISKRSNKEHEVKLIVTTLADGTWQDLENGVNGYMTEYWESIADQTIAFAEKYDIDGVDIDWEYPQTPNDWKVFDNFIARLDDGIQKTKPNAILSGALSSGALGMTEETLDRFDQIQYMAYDGTFCSPALAGDKTAYALFSGAGGVIVFLSLIHI